MKLLINDREREVNVEDGMPLLWVLRDELNMTGTKYGCGISFCGSCAVLIDGKAVRSCTFPVSAAKGKKITTIEGIGTDGNPSAVQKAWIQHQVPQCGYCQSGQIISAEALLDEIPDPTDEDIDRAMTNICRCGTYQRMRQAVHSAAEMRKSESTLLG